MNYASQFLGMERGKLNAVKNAVTNKNFAENFVFDATGNWLVYERDDNGDQVWDLSQARTHNKANEITCLDSSHANIAHDRNGNMVKMPKPDSWSAAYDCVYDAWNRLVQVKDGNTVTATYKYNGRNQRIRKTVGTVVTESQFNHNWQELESKTGSVTTTYVWGLRYIDDFICRDKGSERLFALQDANWNVVAITDTNGVVKERIAYNAFGYPGWLDVNHGPKTTSGYAWNRTFTGQVHDSETGLMLYRNRFYHPGLGRFMRRDPIQVLSEKATYRYCRNNGVVHVDPSGNKRVSTEISVSKGVYAGLGVQYDISGNYRTKPCCDEEGNYHSRGFYEGKFLVTIQFGIGLGGKLHIGAWYVDLLWTGPQAFAKFPFTVANDECGKTNFCKKLCAGGGVQLGSSISIAKTIFLLEGQIDVSGEVKICKNWGPGCSQEGIAIGFCGSIDGNLILKVGFVKTEFSLSDYEGTKSGLGTRCHALVGDSKMLEA